MENTRKRKGLVIITRKEQESLERLISTLYSEVLSSRAMLQSVIDSDDSDPFKEARMYLAEGECSKAIGHADILCRYADAKFYKGS